MKKRAKFTFTEEELEAAQYFIRRIQQMKSYEEAVQIREEMGRYIVDHNIFLPGTGKHIEWINGYNECLNMYISSYEN